MLLCTRRGAPLLTLVAACGEPALPSASIATSEQGGEARWSTTFGGSERDRLGAIAVAPDGDLALAGSFTGAIDLGGAAVTAPDSATFVARLDGRGAHRWSRILSGDAHAHAIAFGPDGRLYLAGSFSGEAALDGEPALAAEGSDGFVVALEADGALGWQRVLGGAGDDAIVALAVDATGLAIAGERGSDAFVSALDPGGEPLWTAVLASDGVDALATVALDATGVVVAGSFTSPTVFAGSALGYAFREDVVLARFDRSGTPAWSHAYGGLGADAARAVALAPDGSVVLGGFFTATIDFGGGALESQDCEDVFVASFAPDGTHRWSRNYGGATPQVLERLALDPSGAIAIAGEYYGAADFGTGKLQLLGARDAFVARLDPEGAPLWSGGYGADSAESLVGLALGPAGGVIVAGDFGSSIDFGAGTMQSAGSDDVFLAELSP